MKPVKFYSLLLAVAFSVGAYGQTADEIINKHIEAIGGKEKLSAIYSVRIESTMNVMDNNALNKSVILNGKGYRNDLEVGGQAMVQVYTDKAGWAIMPFGGGDGTPSAMPDDEYKSGAGQIYAVPLLNYAARGEKAELLGQGKVGDINAYKIKVTDKNGVATTYFIDPATYYIIQTTRPAFMMGQPMDITTMYSDFKKSEYGWVTPQKMELDYGGQFSMTGQTNKIEVNASVDESVFELKK